MPSAVDRSAPFAEDFWNSPLDATFTDLASTADGLSADEASARLKRYGANIATADRKTPVWAQILRRFGNPLVLILLVASGLSAVAGDRASFIVIAVIILLSITLDFIQERRAHNAVNALRRSVAIRADVRRDGGFTSILAEALVPGDVVSVTAGDLIPADGRLIAGKDLFVNQALLTGEPYPVETSRAISRTWRRTWPMRPTRCSPAPP